MPFRRRLSGIASILSKPRALGTDPAQGPAAEAAAQRLVRYGRNELRESRRCAHLRRGGNREVDDAQGLALSRGCCRETGIRTNMNECCGTACLLHA
jgi:hypothetical protein